MLVFLPPLIRGWRAALLLAMAALFSPGKASAACGDYITYPGSHPNSHAQSMGEVGDADQADAPAKPPCQGPNCSGSPVREFPPTPTAPITNPTKVQARAFLPHGDERDEACRFFDRDPSSPRPIHRADSIFHPPRLG